MAITINTNIPAQQAQISLERAQNGLDTAMQRLATGYRINSAADDAAGLQISNRMTAQINGLTVAARNANDGISIAQTAEGAMSETTSLLQQIRDLAVQSASDSNSEADRGALNEEVVQLVDEINRIASTTSFGGQNLLDGSFSTKNIQVGAYANEVIPISVASTAGNKLGILGVQVDFAGFTLGQPSQSTPEDPGGVAAQNLTVGVNGLNTTIPVVSGASASEIVAAVSGAVPKVTGLANTSVTVDYSGITNFATGATLSITVNGTEVTSPSDAASLADAVAGLVAGLQSNNIEASQGGAAPNSATPASGSAKSGMTLSASTLVPSTALIITDPSGANMMISSAGAGRNADASQTPAVTGVPAPSFDKVTIFSNNYDGTALALASNASNTPLVEGKTYMATGAIQWVATNPTDTYTFKSSGNMVGVTPNTEVPGTMGSAVGMSVDTLDISTYTGAQQAVQVVDRALADIDSNRATLGAIQNRFQHTIYNLQNVRENMMASRSRIEDTDYASEMSTLTKEQVLKQASMASLNRANQMQQDVLTLIN